MAKSESHTSTPSWIWLFTGVAAGLFLAFLYHLAGIDPTSENRGIAITSTGASAQDTASKFDFYTLLPDKEVVTPSPSKATPHQSSTSRKLTPHHAPNKVIIQTGSFKSAQDADHRRAQLILLGLEAQIQAVELKPGETWHRVQIGPFSNRSNLNTTQTTLAQNKIEHILLRLKK